MPETMQNALVLFSGGQDSAVCLAFALDRYQLVETVGFDYGQRHDVELTCRRDFLADFRRKFPAKSGCLGEDHLIDAKVLKSLGESAMTHDVSIEMQANGLPSTFVPGRNLLFLTLAGALAVRRGIGVLVGGMCETDFSGYPDCREATMKSQQETLRLGLDYPIEIVTPLMFKSKADAWQMSHELGGDTLVDLIIEQSHTCYLGDRSQRFDWGYGCGTCPACELRAKGWQDWSARAPA